MSNPSDATRKGKKSGVALPAREEQPKHKSRVEDLRPSDISRDIARKLGEAFSPEEIIAGIKTLLDARIITKSGASYPAYTAVEAGLKLWLAYVIGLPVQRSEIVQINLDGVESLRERAADSPALQRAAKRILEMRLEQEMSEKSL